jgi:hypothetical protein
MTTKSKKSTNFTYYGFVYGGLMKQGHVNFFETSEDVNTHFDHYKSYYSDSVKGRFVKVTEKHENFMEELAIKFSKELHNNNTLFECSVDNASKTLKEVTGAKQASTLGNDKDNATEKEETKKEETKKEETKKEESKVVEKKSKTTSAQKQQKEEAVSDSDNEVKATTTTTASKKKATSASPPTDTKAKKTPVTPAPKPATKKKPVEKDSSSDDDTSDDSSVSDGDSDISSDSSSSSSDGEPTKKKPVATKQPTKKK